MSDEDAEAVAKLKRETLEFLTYTDDMGLWEPFHTVRTWEGLAPSERDPEAEAVAEVAVRELYEAGMIHFYRRPWADTEADAVPLSVDEVEHELRASWWRQVPLERGDIWISAADDRSAVG